MFSSLGSIAESRFIAESRVGQSQRNPTAHFFVVLGGTALRLSDPTCTFRPFHYLLGAWDMVVALYFRLIPSRIIVNSVQDMPRPVTPIGLPVRLS